MSVSSLRRFERGVCVCVRGAHSSRWTVALGGMRGGRPVHKQACRHKLLLAICAPPPVPDHDHPLGPRAVVLAHVTHHERRRLAHHDGLRARDSCGRRAHGSQGGLRRGGSLPSVPPPPALRRCSAQDCKIAPHPGRLPRWLPLQATWGRGTHECAASVCDVRGACRRRLAPPMQAAFASRGALRAPLTPASL